MPCSTPTYCTRNDQKFAANIPLRSIFIHSAFPPLQVDDISLFLSKLLEQKSCTGVTDHLREWVSGRKSAQLFHTVPSRAKGLRVWVPGSGPDSPCYTADVSDVDEAVSELD